jgi:hypothetical protein
VTVSFDRNYDAEDAEPAADRLLRASPEVDRGKETADRAETGPGTGDRAFGELVLENAELYRRIAAQDKTIAQLRQRADRSDARFHAWANEMAIRDEAQAKREEALTDRIAELERKPADSPAASDPRGAERRLSEPENAGEESGQEGRKRTRLSNEFIGIGMAASVEAVTAIADPTPSNLIIGALGMVSAGIPWIRKLREAGSGDRPQD